MWCCTHGKPSASPLGDCLMPECKQQLRAEEAQKILDQNNIVNATSAALKQWILTGEWPEETELVDMNKKS